MYANPAGIRQLRLPDKSSESYDYITTDARGDAVWEQLANFAGTTASHITQV